MTRSYLAKYLMTGSTVCLSETAELLVTLYNLTLLSYRHLT